MLYLYKATRLLQEQGVKTFIKAVLCRLEKLLRLLILDILCLFIFDTININIKLLSNLYRGCSAEDLLEKIYFEAKNKQTIVELGLGNAYTTSVLLLSCRDGVGHLWTVDWCKDLDSNLNLTSDPCKRAIQRIKKLGLENYWSFYKGTFSKFIEKWNSKRARINFLFIDEDGVFDMDTLLEKYDPSISSDGVIYVHNVGIREKTRKEVLSFCAKRSWACEFQNTKYGLAILKRKLRER